MMRCIDGAKLSGGLAMDRRGFLKSGGAAAMAAGAASAAAQANPVDSGVGGGRHGLWPGARCLTLAVAFFAGLPFGEGLPAADLQAWLTIGG